MKKSLLIAIHAISMMCYAYGVLCIWCSIYNCMHLIFFFYKFHNIRLQILQWTHVVLPLVHQEIVDILNMESLISNKSILHMAPHHQPFENVKALSICRIMQPIINISLCVWSRIQIMLNIWSINALLINEKNAYGPHDKIKFMFINQNIIRMFPH